MPLGGWGRIQRRKNAYCYYYYYCCCCCCYYMYAYSSYYYYLYVEGANGTMSKPTPRMPDPDPVGPELT